jgi:hypothetical protein
MKTTIDYGTIPDREERDKKAIQDIVDFLGKEKYDELVATAEDPESEIELLELLLGVLSGIEGLPLHAFYRKHCLDRYLAWARKEWPNHVFDEKGFSARKKA